MNRREMLGLSAGALVPAVTGTTKVDDPPPSEVVPDSLFDRVQKDREVLKDGFYPLVWPEVDAWVRKVLPRAEPLLAEAWDYGVTLLRGYLPPGQLVVTVKCLGVRRVFHPDVDGFEAFWWPETKTLLGRLGYPYCFYEKDLSFSVGRGEQPTVTVKCIATQPKDLAADESARGRRSVSPGPVVRPDWKSLRAKLARGRPAPRVVETTSPRFNTTITTSAPGQVP